MRLMSCFGGTVPTEPGAEAVAEAVVPGGTEVAVELADAEAELE